MKANEKLNKSVEGLTTLFGTTCKKKLTFIHVYLCWIYWCLTIMFNATLSALSIHGGQFSLLALERAEIPRENH